MLHEWQGTCEKPVHLAGTATLASFVAAAGSRTRAMEVGWAALQELATWVRSGQLWGWLSADVEEQLVAAAQAAVWVANTTCPATQGDAVDAAAWGRLGRRVDDAGHMGGKLVQDVFSVSCSGAAR